MRLQEFANAQAQLGLWKLISDNTWAAVNQQAQKEARAQAEKAAARKSTPHKRGVRKSTPKAAAPKPSVPITPKQAQAQAQAQTATPSVQPQQPTAAQAVIPTKGPLGASNPTKSTALPTAPSAPTAQLKLSARQGGVVSKAAPNDE